ncbi:hypothetical protein [Streptomyces sp. BPTC-684]|uniref:hypothetical protein n=1 Tax=Streptomyces sp. BPTC-684 TaxID=3043734 RepID=UPI0024B050E3|nr:hypothetical protein [Streptomyces sp. BPTC-684]WHM36627.1 hypothetical protein QIY60_06515 [Streptomyces sp. BPTC-684]
MARSPVDTIRHHPIWSSAVLVALIGAAATIIAAYISNRDDTGSPDKSDVPAAFVGRWQGDTAEHDNGQTATYDTTLTLRDGTEGSEVGETDYVFSGKRCKGTVRLSSVSGNTLHLDERIDQGSCVPSGIIRVTLDGTMRLNFSYAGTKRDRSHQTIEGSLSKMD